MERHYSHSTPRVFESMVWAAVALFVAGSAGCGAGDNHMLAKYPDLPKVKTDGAKMTLMVSDRQYSIVRPIVPELDLSKFQRKLHVDKLASAGERQVAKLEKVKRERDNDRVKVCLQEMLISMPGQKESWIL